MLVTPSLKWFITQEGTSSYGEVSSLLWLLKDYKGSLLLAEKDVTAKDWCWSRVCQRVSSPWMTKLPFIYEVVRVAWLKHDYQRGWGDI